MRLILVGLAVASLTSCSGLTQHSIFGSKEGGYVSIEADSAGMHALSDWTTGTATEAKASPDVKSAYYQLREEQERQKTIRIQLPRMKKEAK